jgi:hypothetical protein
MIQYTSPNEARRQMFTSMLSLLIVALLLAGGELAIHASNFVLSIPMPVVS